MNIAINGTHDIAGGATRRQGDPAYLVADNAKALSLLGWTPRYGIEEIVATAYEWHRKGNI